MTTFLQAYVDKVDNSKLRITLKVLNDLVNYTEKKFLLPDQKSAFIRLTEDLYNSEQQPIGITKQQFKTDFVDYTLSLDISAVNSDTLTNHYKDFFSQHQKDEIESMVSGVDAWIQTQADAIKQQTDASVVDYVKAKEENATNISHQPAHEMAQAVQRDQQFSSSRPSTPGERPVKDMTGLSGENASTLNDLPQGITSNLHGIAGDRLIEPVPAPLLYPGDVHQECENNAGVIFGRDEVYRLRGHTKSGACYLYAGRSPNNIQTTAPPEDGVGPAQYLRKPNDLVRDAAYLYLSQKADVDSLLKVAGGTYAKATNGPEARMGFSVAAMKADDVVIMARESGIRLITGMDKVNSRGGELTAKFGIDLIAGNNDEDLQPLVKGDNLITYLEGLSKMVNDLKAILYRFITSQIDMNAALADHTHYDPFSIFLGTLAAGDPLVINKGHNYMSQKVMKAGAKALLDATQLQKDTVTWARNNTNNDSNGFGDLGGYKIVSEKNRTN